MNGPMKDHSAYASRAASRSILLALFAVASCIAVLLISAGTANASFNITDFKMTPSSLQAGSHPNVHFHIDPDATLADNSNGDDLKQVVLDFPAGALGNPEAATPKCTSAQFNADACPASSYIGSMSIDLRIKVKVWFWTYYTTLHSPGSMYILDPPTPGSAITVGFIVRPPGYRLIFLKSEVTGVVKVRSGVDADYGLTISVNNIPRNLQTTWGSNVPSTVQDISVDLASRANTSGTGPYFTFLPTRCDAATTKATISSYAGVVKVKNDSFTATGCNNVPFTPTSSYAVSDSTEGASTGIAATFNVPTADAPIQQSHVKEIITDLPQGTKFDFPNISAVGALCTFAQLDADNCPAASKIGVVSAEVPFLPPTMTGDVYMITRNNDVVFGYILRGSNGVKAPLKGRAYTVDADNDGSADFIRAKAELMPQAPWTTATINFTSKLIRNPESCGPQTINTQITGWSGKVVNTTNTYDTTNCNVDNEDPVVTITSPADGATVNSALLQVDYTAIDNVGVTSCNIASGDSVTLTPGPNTVTVTCEDAAGNTGSDSVNVTYQVPDTQAPIVSIVSPADGSVTGASSVTLDYNVVDNQDPSPSCTPADGSSVSLDPGANTITVSCTDAAGNTGTATTTVTRDVNAPVVVITSPADGSSTTYASTNVSYTVSDDFDSSPTCTPANNSSVSLSMGSNTITVTCTDDAGNSGSDSVTVTRSTNPPPVITITAPADGTITGATSVVLTYTVTDDSGVAPTCDKASGSSQALSAGSNTISVTCTDNQGGSSTESVTVIRDATGPAISITAPADGSVTQGATATLNYTVTDNYDASPTCTPADGSSVNLSNGANTITVVCNDAYGNSSSASVTVTRDNAGPSVNITSPADNSVTTASSVAVNYSVSDDFDSAPTCDVASGSSVNLSNGANTITVTCTDDAGNSGSDSVTVLRDNNAPVITITAPADGSTTTYPTTTLSYTVTDDFDSSPTCSPASGSTVNLSSGANEITVTCTDDAGNSSSASVTVNRGTNPPPVISNISPADGTVTQSNSVNLTYTATDDSGIAPTCTPPSGSNIGLSEGDNAITITCEDNQGATTTETIHVISDSIAPSVNITSPADNSVTSAGTIPVNYTVSDATDSSPNCSIADGDSVVLAPDANTITVTCTDDAGNSGSDSVTVYRDVTGPSVNITSPANNTVTNQSTIAVTYTVSDNYDSSPTCNIASGANVNLNNGPNTITVTCTDDAGNASSDSVTVTRDSAGPTVTITSPTDGTVTAASSVTVNYTAIDNDDPSPSCNIASGASVNLSAGSNTITVTCEDNSGNQGSASVTVIRDNTGPVVEITSPANNTETNQSSIPVSYTVTDNHDASPSCNIASGASVNLSAGSNTITVTCEDSVGNTGSDSVTVVRDNVAPVVTITSPTNGLETQANSVTLNYTVDDAGATCTLANGSSVTLSSGSNTITVSCTDDAGNTGTASVTVVRDNTKPVVDITSPAAGTVTGASSIAVTYTVNDAVDSSPSCSIANGASVPLSAGSNTITVSCTDNAGNVGTDSINVIRDATGPTITINSPVNGSSTQSSSVTLDYTVSDNYDANPSCSPADGSSVSLDPGPNTITVTCTDASGNTSTATSTVTRSNNASPVITITSPTNGLVTKNATVTLTYTATDDSGIAPTCTPASGSTITLSNGSNQIDVTCTDNLGLQTVKSVTVIRDTQAPVVNITIPTDGLVTADDSVNVTYSVTDNVDSSPTCDLASGAAVNLSNGVNTITVTCSDDAGNSGTDSVQVTRDNGAPVVNITAPVDGTSTQSSTATLDYTVSDDFDSSPSCTLADGATVNLSAGSNTITVTCTDEAGNTGSDSVTVIRDNTAPSVNITSPADNTVTGASSIAVSYTVSDAVDASPSCNIASGTSVNLSSGSNTVTVTCTDDAGNSGSDSVTVIRDTVGPAVSISSPANNTVTNQSSIAVSYTVSDNYDATPSCNIASGASVNLSAGSNTITITCTDDSGNTGSASVTVIRDNVGPAVDITSPLNNAVTNQASIAVSYTVTDNVDTTPSCNIASGASVNLSNGSNTITVTCTDDAGNTGSDSVTVVRDSATPS